MITPWTKLPPQQRGLFLTEGLCLEHTGLWSYWCLLSGEKWGVVGAFERRHAQQNTTALLSQLQIFLMGHVLLLPSMALAPHGASKGHETPPDQTPEPGCRILHPRARGDGVGPFWVHTVLSSLAAMTPAAPSNLSTWLTLPNPTARQSLPSFFCHAAPSATLGPSVPYPVPAPLLMQPWHRCLPLPHLRAS